MWKAGKRLRCGAHLAHIFLTVEADASKVLSPTARLPIQQLQQRKYEAKVLFGAARDALALGRTAGARVQRNKL